MLVNNPRTCLYRPLQMGIQQYIFRDVTPQAVHEFISYLEYIIPESPQGVPVRVLMDVRSGGLPPANVMRKALKAFFERHPNCPPLRVAVLYDTLPRRSRSADIAALIPRRANDEIYLVKTNVSVAINWLTSAQTT